MHTNHSGIRDATTSARAIALTASIASVLVVFGACTDVGEEDTSTSSGTTSAVTSVTSGVTTSTSTSTGSGGVGGQGGAGGGSGCLDPATASSLFTLGTDDLCVVATYTAPDLTLAAFGVQPTWGRHHGPLTSTVMSGATSDEIHVERWTISGATLAKVETIIGGVTQIPATGFVGAQTVDVPFGGLTAVSWSGQDFTHQGGVVFFDGTHVTDDYLATGVFGTAAFGTAASSRVLYTGLSAFDGPTNATVGLYAADFTNGVLGTSQAIAPWGEATGPVAVDSASNVIAINTKFSDGTQEIRGFASTNIAEGQGATAGQVLLSTDGYGTALAAVAPKGPKPGLVVYQPQTGATGTYGNAIVVRYTVVGSTMAATAPAPILELATADTPITLMTDDQDRVWVGAAATQGAVFYVLARP